MSLVVRVTARRSSTGTRGVFRARAQALDPGGFVPLAYQAACREGLDEVSTQAIASRVAWDPAAGQLDYLADPAAVVAGIPGVAVEDAAMAVEPTPAQVVRRVREDHELLEQPEDDDEDAEDEGPGEGPFPSVPT